MASPDLSKSPIQSKRANDGNLVERSEGGMGYGNTGEGVMVVEERS